MAVSTMATHRLNAAFVDVHTIVGHDAVKIENNGVQGAGNPLLASRSLVGAEQGLGDQKISRVIDLELPIGRDLPGNQLPAEPVSAGDEGVRSHHVDCTVF